MHPVSLPKMSVYSYYEYYILLHLDLHRGGRHDPPLDSSTSVAVIRHMRVVHRAICMWHFGSSVAAGVGWLRSTSALGHRVPLVAFFGDESISAPSDRQCKELRIRRSKGLRDEGDTSTILFSCMPLYGLLF